MIKIIAFGKIKSSPFLILRNEYLKKASFLSNIKLIEFKQQSAKDVTAKIRSYKKSHPEEQLFLLSEEGKDFTSKTFATLLQKNLDETLTFVIGPAEGFEQAVKQECTLFSLSPLTMMHELAQVVFFEQVYRAVSINKGLPYHKD